MGSFCMWYGLRGSWAPSQGCWETVIAPKAAGPAGGRLNVNLFASCLGCRGQACVCVCVWWPAFPCLSLGAVVRRVCVCMCVVACVSVPVLGCCGQACVWWPAFLCPSHCTDDRVCSWRLCCEHRLRSLSCPPEKAGARPRLTQRPVVLQAPLCPGLRLLAFLFHTLPLALFRPVQFLGLRSVVLTPGCAWVG